MIAPMTLWTRLPTPWRDRARASVGILGLVLLSALLPSPASGQAALTILHTNESGSELEALTEGPFKGLGGLARRATLIAQIRKESPHVLLIASGGLPPSALEAEATIVAMNVMGYDALILGNHDFEIGPARLNQLRQQARFPFLCTNFRPPAPDLCQRSAVKSVGPLRIGLIGLASPPADMPQNQVEAPIEAARAAVAELRERVELFVTITRESTEDDLALAQAIPALDVIIGGHTEGFDGLVPPGSSVPAEGRTELVGGGPIFVKSYRQGRALGRLDLLYHDRTIMVAEARNLPVGPPVLPDQKVVHLVQEYTQRLRNQSSASLSEHASTGEPRPSLPAP